MQGLYKPVTISEKLTALGSLSETLENIPARSAGTRDRNYVAALFGRYKGKLINTDTRQAHILTARELLAALGTFSYTDYAGNVVPDMRLDLVYEYMIAHGIVRPGAKGYGPFGGVMGITIPAATPANGSPQADGELEFDFEVPLFAYAPDAIGEGRGIDFNDGVCAASMLGKQASLKFSGVGTNGFYGNQYVDFEKDEGGKYVPMSIKLTALLWKTREVIVPVPRRYEAVLWESQDPYVEKGEARKPVFIGLTPVDVGHIDTDIGIQVRLNAINATANLRMTGDGDEIVDGPCEDVLRVVSMMRPVDSAFMAATQGQGPLYNPATNNDYFAHEMAVLVDPHSHQTHTQKPAFTELKIHGMRSVQGHQACYILEEYLRTPDRAEYDRFCEREGILANERQDIRLTDGSMPLSQVDLDIGATIGVAKKVGSAKERARSNK